MLWIYSDDDQQHRGITVTTGKKGEQGFQPVYNPEDFKSVLTEKPMKNSQVRAALIKKYKNKYKKISSEWVKQTLITLSKAGEISGGKDEGLGLYLWWKMED